MHCCCFFVVVVVVVFSKSMSFRYQVCSILQLSAVFLSTIVFLTVQDQMGKLIISIILRNIENINVWRILYPQKPANRYNFI